MKVLALSYLFPSPAQPEYGIFVHHRLKAVQEFCSIKVIAPVQHYPLRALLRPGLAVTGAVPRRAELDGVEVWYPRFPVVPRYFKSFDAFSYFYSVRPVVRRLVAAGFAFDLIDVHWTYPDILAAFLLARRYGKPFVVTVRGHEALYPGERGGRKRILDRCLRRADAVVALSSQLAGEVVRLGVPRDRVRVVLNGVDTGIFRPLERSLARRTLGLADDKTILLSVGRLTEAKGHQHLIAALPFLRDRHAVELHLIGGINPEGDFRARLKGQAARQGLENVFLHHGVPHERLLYWYNAADLFCLASHGEGCPNVVLEAMSCGTPVVVSDVGSVRDLVAEGESGVIVRDRDRFGEALARALSVTWNRRGIAERMQGMSWRRCAAQVAAIYREVVGEGGGIHEDSLSPQDAGGRGGRYPHRGDGAGVSSTGK